MFSQTVDYALRASTYLAHEAPEARTTEQIAEVTFVPPAYLSKVLQSLVRGGLVRSQRGVKGGFSLSRPPADISILEVINSVDPIRRTKENRAVPRFEDGVLRGLHDYLEGTIRTLEKEFGDTSLENILQQSSEPVGAPEQVAP